MSARRRRLRRQPPRLLASLGCCVVFCMLAVALPVPSGAADDSILANRGIRPEEGEVERLYLSVFGREPDAAGFDFWVVKRLAPLCK